MIPDPVELDLAWHKAMLGDAVRIFKEMRDDQPVLWRDEIDDFLESYR